MTILFTYLYRDAGNFKAYGQIALHGTLSPEKLSSMRKRLFDDGWFIAEQLDVPPLYKALYKWSDGPTPADHCWHDFIDVREMEPSEATAQLRVWGEASDFFKRVRSIAFWNEELSPHFRLEV